MKLRQMTPDDWGHVRQIYEQGIQTKLATFETQVPSWEKWDAGHLNCGRLIAEQHQQILGWAALSPISTRSAYAGVAEVSVYIGVAARQQGVGKLLLTRLVAESEENGLWMLQASIFRLNQASIHLHEKCGFRMIGHRERIAQLDGVWYDTVLMERRSAVIGI